LKLECSPGWLFLITGSSPRLTSSPDGCVLVHDADCHACGIRHRITGQLMAHTKGLEREDALNRHPEQMKAEMQTQEQHRGRMPDAE
jgi:hypothetical protein